MKRVLELFSNPSFVILRHYLVFLLLCWPIHTLVISVFSFLHFLLGHNLQIIEEWIYHYGLTIVCLSKLISFFIIIKFISLRSVHRRPLRLSIIQGLQAPREIHLIGFFSLFLGVIFLMRPELKIDIFDYWQKTFANYIGTVFYYFIDFFVYYSSRQYLPRPSKGGLLFYVLYALFFFIFGKGTFLYMEGLGPHVFFSFLLVLIFSEVGPLNWLVSSLFILLFIAPISSFLGLDPMYGTKYTFFKIEQSSMGVSYGLISVTVMLYMYFKSRKHWRKV
jgi:hypothetical protein